MTHVDTTPETAHTTDVIDACAGLSASDAVYALRRQRPKIVAATQGSYTAMWAPEVVGISVPERLLIALHASVLSGVPSLAQHYLARLQALNTAAEDIAAAQGLAQATQARLAALLAFTGKLINKPIEGDQHAVQSLVEAGLTPAAIVAVGQLIAFLSYQIRLVAGLAALHAAGAAPEALAQETTAAPATAPAALLANPIRIKGFTNEVLDWRAWVDPVRLADASPEQLAALEAMSPTAKDQDYFLLLAHQPTILLERSIAFNAIMFAPGGMPRAERELAATVESRLNGCVYCASVHAQRFEQLAKRNDLMAQVFEDPANAGESARERAIVRLSTAVSLTPAQLQASDIASARAAGLNDGEILDLIHVVALFAWANRLMLNLGEPIHKDGTLAEKAKI